MTPVLVGLLPLLAVIGCAAKVERHRSMGVRFIYADASAISDHCKKLQLDYERKTGKPSHYDDGAPVREGDGRRSRCCHRKFRGRSTVWVGIGEESCIPHELCHAEGRAPADCNRFHLGQGSSPYRPGKDGR